MREASTKPSAATVLPAPVACSNQKRLAALGSSGCLGDVLAPRPRRDPCSSPAAPRARRPRRPRRRPPRRGSPAEASRRDRRRPPTWPLPLPLPLRWASASSAVSVPESASTWWAESTVPSTSVRLLLARAGARGRAAATTARRHCDRRAGAAGVELGQRRVERDAARACPARARSRASSPSRQEGLAGERRGPLEISSEVREAWPDRPLAWIQPRKGETFGEETAAAVRSERLR